MIDKSSMQCNCVKYQFHKTNVIDIYPYGSTWGFIKYKQFKSNFYKNVSVIHICIFIMKGDIL